MVNAQATTEPAPEPRPGHRNALLLGPFDEIGHNQEIAGKPHFGDDAQLISKAARINTQYQPRVGFLSYCHQPLGLTLCSLGLAAPSKGRQNDTRYRNSRCAHPARNFNCVFGTRPQANPQTKTAFLLPISTDGLALIAAGFPQPYKCRPQYIKITYGLHNPQLQTRKNGGRYQRNFLRVGGISQ